MDSLLLTKSLVRVPPNEKNVSEITRNTDNDSAFDWREQKQQQAFRLATTPASTTSSSSTTTDISKRAGEQTATFDNNNNNTSEDDHQEHHHFLTSRSSRTAREIPSVSLYGLTNRSNTTISILPPPPPTTTTSLSQQRHHMVTAAEIALGTPSSLQQFETDALSSLNNNQSSFSSSSTMGDGSRNIPSSSNSNSRDTGMSSSSSTQSPGHHGESKQQEQRPSSSAGKEEESGGEAVVVGQSATAGGGGRGGAGGRRTPNHDTSDLDSATSLPDQSIRLTMIGTPSTASTAPSSADEASIGTADYRLDESLLPNLLHPLGDLMNQQHPNQHQHHHHNQQHLHRRSDSWDDDDVLLPPQFNRQPLMNFGVHIDGAANNFPSSIPTPPSQNPWGNTVERLTPSTAIGSNNNNMGQLLPQSQPNQAQWGSLTPRRTHQHQHQQPGQHQHQLMLHASHPPSHPQSHPQAPAQHLIQPQRVATFRNEGSWAQHVALGGQHHTPQQHSNQKRSQQQQQPHNQSTVDNNATASQSTTGKGNLQIHPGSSVGVVAPHPPAASNRNARHPRHAAVPSSGAAHQQQSVHQQTTSPGPASHRSSSEVLKTLLRKKACLYEPDTSRSVALVTWLVGRELALEYGFFSRQQLQSGVHSCVASKIDSGIITRTKVNRCMQIILNSCFHYIIPRSDGTEESGESFRVVFANAVQNDFHLLQYLPEPWNDLVVNREAVLEACDADEDDESTRHAKESSSTPKSSPRFSSVNASASANKAFEKDADHHDDHESKRSVLLCFNENVRSAEDVFRCHNEFIRDTANAAHLQLTAQEWRNFFGREVSRAPHLWGSVGIPTLTGESNAGPARQPDLLGQMSREEAAKFRTSWCTKRYEHNHDLCGFAHAEVSGGWLRRNPTLYTHKDAMCPHVTPVTDKQVSPHPFFLNECPKGVMCENAHSTEEMLYHPNRYKTTVCRSLYSRSGGCRLGDVCPHLHPPESTRPLKKSEGRSQGHRRKNSKDANAPGQSSGLHGGNKPPNASAPSSAPVVYASPAPLSSFEQQLLLPGLRNLYRRHSAVVRAHVRSSGKCTASYRPFGDDWGISINTTERSSGLTKVISPKDTDAE